MSIESEQSLNDCTHNNWKMKKKLRFRPACVFIYEHKNLQFLFTSFSLRKDAEPEPIHDFTPISAETVVFDRQTLRIFSGCSAQLILLKISGIIHMEMVSWFKKNALSKKNLNVGFGFFSLWKCFLSGLIVCINLKFTLFQF